MSYGWSDDLMGQRLRVLQMVIAALVMGAVMFLVIALLMPMPQGGAPVAPANDPEPQLPILTYTLIGFALLCLVARLMVPNLYVAWHRTRIAQGTWQLSTLAPPPPDMRQWLDKSGDTAKLFLVYHSKTILAAALVEGPTFALLIAYLLEKQPIALVLAVVFILFLALHFPTRTKVEHWIEQQLQLLSFERPQG